MIFKRLTDDDVIGGSWRLFPGLVASGQAIRSQVLLAIITARDRFGGSSARVTSGVHMPAGKASCRPHAAQL